MYWDSAFFCDICNFSNSKYNEIIKHGKMNHQSQSLDFQVMEEFKEKEKIQMEDKSKTSKIKQKNKNNIRNSAKIYKTYTIIFASEYTSMQDALSKPNLKAVYSILKNIKVNKHEFCFSLCTPVIISKMMGL